MKYEPEFTRAWILQDYESNSGSVRIAVFLILFRAAQAARWPFDRRSRVWLRPIITLYGLYAEWFADMEVPVKTMIGPGLRISHGRGIVVNERSTIGSHVWLRHNVTIGNKGVDGPCPIIQDRVNLGNGVTVIGGITVGADTIVGSNTVVVRSVPAGSVVVGEAGRVL